MAHYMKLLHPLMAFFLHFVPYALTLHPWCASLLPLLVSSCCCQVVHHIVFTGRCFDTCFSSSMLVTFAFIAFASTFTRRSSVGNAAFYDASLYQHLRPSIPLLVGLLNVDQDEKIRSNAAGQCCIHSAKVLIWRVSSTHLLWYSFLFWG